MDRRKRQEQETKVQLQQPWEEILSEAGVDTPSGKGSQRSGRCPFHDDRSPSFSINLEEGKWICHANCGAGTLDSLIVRVTGWTQLQTDIFIRRFSQNAVFSLRDEWHDVEKEDNSPLPELAVDYVRGEVPDWIFERGFTARTLIDAEAGTNGRGGLVLPIRDENRRLVGSVTRQFPGHQPKYLYQSGMKKSRIVFGQYNVQESSFVCLTEGTLDTLWLKQHNFESIAILGASMSARQESIINTLNTSELVLCLDNDEVGKAAAQQIASRLSKRRLVSFARLPKRYKDVQEICDPEILRATINDRTDLGLEGAFEW